MKRKLNKVAIVLCFALAFSGLYGCGKEAEDASAEQTVEETYESDLDSIELTDIEDLEAGRTSMSDPGDTCHGNGYRRFGYTYRRIGKCSGYFDCFQERTYDRVGQVL